MSTHTAFQSMPAEQVQSNLLSLLGQVAANTGRVEIVDPTGQCDCVLVSKKELQGLERALELLSRTEEVKLLSERIAEYAAMDSTLSASA